MKLSKLIRRLEHLQEQLDDDVEVAVQYRDEGGEYLGVDTSLYLYVQNNEVLKEGHWVIKKTIIL